MPRTHLIALLALLAPAAATLAGPVNPPTGPVAPTMKTLQQVEPRTPIGPDTTPGYAGAVYRISQPGNYYLTGDIIGVAGKHGIEINADDVTIDLNGFTLRGVAGASRGISTRLGDDAIVFRNLTVRNGSAVGWPQAAIALQDSIGGHVSGLTLRSNFAGLIVGQHFIISRVVVTGSTSFGIVTSYGCTLSDCIAQGGATGFRVSASTLENCDANNQTTWGFDVDTSILRACNGWGFSAGGINAYGSRVEGCKISGALVGIQAHTGTTVENCKIDSAYHCGIRVTAPNCRIIGNHITESGTLAAPNAAIYVAQGVQNTHIEGNAGTANGRGVYVDGTNNLIIRNSFGRPVQNHLNFFVVAGNRIAPIVAAGTNSVNISSTGGYAGSFTTTDPNANISY